MGKPDVCQNRHGGVETSVEAFKSTSERVRQKQRDRMYAAFVAHKAGLTCEEVETLLKMGRSSASARASELLRDGLLVDTGRRRKTSTGRSARVLSVAFKEELF